MAGKDYIQQQDNATVESLQVFQLVHQLKQYMNQFVDHKPYA